MEREIEFDVEKLTEEELLDPEFIPSIYDYYPEKEEREEVITKVLAIAKSKHLEKRVKKAISKFANVDNLDKLDDNLLLVMKVTKEGKPEVTIDNYVQAITHIDELKNTIKYNEFTQKFERVLSNGKIKSWDDGDDAWCMNIIEKKCGIHDIRKYTQGLLDCKSEFSYHPIKDIIESETWDGVERIDEFLAKVMKCENEEDSDKIYAREVSRMIFYGGIARLYYPGCKFDYMPVLIGEQGTCKSTLVNWLSLDTGSYKEVLTIDGKDSADILRLTWIGEFAELLAMVRAREVESMKAFLSREIDTFRPAYARHTIDVPRHCIFIGTTNTYEFLRDSTGNRRYLPIQINTSRGELYQEEKEIKHYILECWREAKYLMDNNKIYLNIPFVYNDIVEEHVAMAIEDNPQQMTIINYLEDKPIGYKVCGKEIWVNAFGGITKDFTNRKSQEISTLMQGIKNWKRNTNPMVLGDWGRQKYWTKIN